MALAHQSISTINAPEFINLSPLDINPLMSKCEIKVFYLGQNRNGSYISKGVAEQMAKTLRGAPIVGYFKQDKEDFSDHGKQIIIDDQGIKFNCLTKPYGFVSPDAQVWFKDFEESDESGKIVTRTYLMTNGFLWTGQFEEIQKVYEDNGKPHSMQLDDKTIKGEWTKNINSEVQLFIINDAIFSKLCILGDDVEPCFEGSGVTAPQVSASFTLDKNFKQTLFEMMQELTEILKGGSQVADINKEEAIQTEEVAVDFSVEEKDNSNQSSFEENHVEQTVTTDFEEKKNDQEKDQDEEETTEEDSATDDKDDDNTKKKKYTLLKEEFDTLQSNYTALQNEVKELREFKANVENQQKEDLISQFYMLSDEDKKDIIENKDQYTLDEIESKLAVICFKKKVNFNLDSSPETEDNKIVTTFNIDKVDDLSTPDWVKEVENTMNNKY